MAVVRGVCRPVGICPVGPSVTRECQLVGCGFRELASVVVVVDTFKGDLAAVEQGFQAALDHEQVYHKPVIDPLLLRSAIGLLADGGRAGGECSAYAPFAE